MSDVSLLNALQRVVVRRIKWKHLTKYDLSDTKLWLCFKKGNRVYLRQHLTRYMVMDVHRGMQMHANVNHYSGYHVYPLERRVVVVYSKGKQCILHAQNNVSSIAADLRQSG